MSEHVEITAIITSKYGEVEREYVGSQPLWAWEDGLSLKPWKTATRKRLLEDRTGDSRGWRVSFEAGEVFE